MGGVLDRPEKKKKEKTQEGREEDVGVLDSRVENEHVSPGGSERRSEGISTSFPDFFGEGKKGGSSSSSGRVVFYREAVLRYLTDLTEVRSLQEWTSLNEARFGSPVLELDKFGSALLFGFCSGYAFRRALKVTALLCGFGFVSLQTLSYLNYINVNWPRLQRDVETAFDLNKNGKIDGEDMVLLRQKLMSVLTWQLPSAAGFGTGFLFGLRRW